MTPATQHYLYGSYWKEGLLPHSLADALHSAWPLDRLTALLAPGGEASLAYPFPHLYLLLGLFGAWLLYREDRVATLLVFAPLLAALAAAAVRLYPLSDRLILFLLPSFFLGASAAIDWLRSRASTVSPYAGIAVVVLLAGSAILPIVHRPPPYWIDDVKPVLLYLQQHRLPGDAVYVYYDTGPAISFYAHRFGMREKDYAAGGCHRGDTRAYLPELDRFRGQPRVWVLATHADPRYGERDNILRYLDAMGRRRDSRVFPSWTVTGYSTPAEIYLYDLSDMKRLNAISAASFRLDGREDPRPCDHGPTAMAKKPQDYP